MKYPPISQRAFESVVRKTYAKVVEHRYDLNPVPTALALSHMLVMLDQQPGLAEGQRLKYNLGRAKWEWMISVYSDYQNTRQGE